MCGHVGHIYRILIYRSNHHPAPIYSDLITTVIFRQPVSGSWHNIVLSPISIDSCTTLLILSDMTKSVTVNSLIDQDFICSLPAACLPMSCHGAAVGRLNRLHWLPVLDVLMFCNISLFLSLSGLSESVYKVTLPYFLFFFLFPFSCLIFSLYGYIA